MLQTSEILKIAGEINQSSVTRLILPNKNISNTSNLVEFIRVFFLNLANNSIQDYQFIQFMPEIKIINLQNNQLDTLSYFNFKDENEKYFFKSLEILYLSNNKIRDLGEISYLTEATNLNIIDLRNNPILDQKGFQQTLLELTSVKTLNGVRVRTCTGLIIDYEKKEPIEVENQDKEIEIQPQNWISPDQFNTETLTAEDFLPTSMFNKVMDSVQLYWEQNKENK